jgi:hypothetical protein
MSAATEPSALNAGTICEQRFRQFVAKCEHLASRHMDDCDTNFIAVNDKWKKRALLDKLYVRHTWTLRDGECHFSYENGQSEMILSKDGDKLWTDNGRSQWY